MGINNEDLEWVIIHAVVVIVIVAAVAFAVGMMIGESTPPNPQ